MKTHFLLQILALLLSGLLIVTLFLAAAGKISWLWFWGAAIIGFIGAGMIKGVRK